MREGSGLVRFSQEYPERYFDVGIAEQHAVTFAAGLACEGMKPVVAIYSTFLQRGYDQLIHDVALQNLPVVFAIDRAGIVGADGATHIGAFDLSYLRCLPNMTVMAPADENECRQMLYTAFTLDTPAAVRYPRGSGPGRRRSTPALTALPVGKGEVRARSDAAHEPDRDPRVRRACCSRALAAGGDARRDRRQHALRQAARRRPARAARAQHDALVTVEENVVAGGAGSAVAEALAAGVTVPILHLGLPDAFRTMAIPRCSCASAGSTPRASRRRSRGASVRRNSTRCRNRPPDARCADECVYDGNIARIADARARSSGNVSFTLNALPTTARGFRPSRSTACASSVKPSSPGSANARRSTPKRNICGVCARTETFARLRPHHARVVVDTFQCVRDRQCEEAADVVVRELALQSQRAVRVDARPRGIVHHDPVVIDTGHSR